MNVFNSTKRIGAVVASSLVACLGLAQTSAPVTGDPARQNVVVLDPFTISTESVRGYAATNSLSATRINTPVLEIPATINIVTKEFMADFGYNTIEQAVMGVPGVAKRANNEFHFQEFFMIRGFNSNLNLKNRVPYRINTDASFVEQIEIVKGPQTVLYGLADPGGLVNVITKKPLSTRRAEVTAKFGSEDFRRGSVDLTGPVGESGKLLYRLTGSYEESKSWMRNGFWEQVFVTPALTFRPFQNTKLDLEYTYQRRDHAFQRPSLPVDAAATRYLNNDRYYSPITPDDDTTVRGDSFEVSVTQMIGDRVTARATVADVQRRTDMYNYVGSISQPVLTNGAITGYSFTPINNVEQATGKGRHYYLELNVSDIRTGGLAHNFLLGFQQDDTSDENYFWRRPDPSSTFNPLTPPAQVRLRYSRQEIMSFAARGGAPLASEGRGFYLIDSIKAFDGRANVLGGLRHDDLGVAGERTTPQIGGNFQVAKGIYVYGLYSESFVPNPPRFDQGLSITRSFVPTESEGFDVGVKFDLWDSKLTGAVSLFKIDRSNIVQAFFQVPVPPGIPQFYVSGLERSEGAEVELFYSPNDAWQFILSYAYTDARIVETTTPNDVGLRLAQAAPNAYSVTAKHTVRNGPLKGLTAGGILLRRDGPIPIVATFANRRLVENGYTNVDLFVGYDTQFFGKPTKISLNLSNATDAVFMDRQGALNAPRQAFVQTRLIF